MITGLGADVCLLHGAVIYAKLPAGEALPAQRLGGEGCRSLLRTLFPVDGRTDGHARWPEAVLQETQSQGHVVAVLHLQSMSQVQADGSKVNFEQRLCFT